MSTAPTQLHIDADKLLTHQMTRLHRHLRGKVACDEDARDIAQEACLKMLQASRKTNDIRNSKAYLYRIAHYLLYHHYTTQTRRCEATDVDIDGLLSTGDDVETITIDARFTSLTQRMRSVTTGIECWSGWNFQPPVAGR